MLICSFNVKDLGGLTKRRKVRDLILANSLEFVVIQKTKLLLVSDILVHSIWGNTFYKWNFFLLLVIIVCVRALGLVQLQSEDSFFLLWS